MSGVADLEPAVGGRLELRGGPAELVGRGGPLARLEALAERLGGPLGGGGVGAEGVASEPPAFLLTHFLSSGS